MKFKAKDGQTIDTNDRDELKEWLLSNFDDELFEQFLCQDWVADAFDEFVDEEVESLMDEDTSAVYCEYYELKVVE